jgi:microcystin-dependent protein
MPSTFTDNTGIEKIADGEQTGAWGQITNDNFDIIDRALNGSVSIALSGTTHTLTTSDGILSDGQYAVLVFTGSPSGTNTVTIVPNTAQKTYIVRNTTAQSVVLTQGSGANVTVPAGLTKLVYADGGGATAAVVDITNTLSGNLTGNVTGNVTTATAWQTARTLTINGVGKSVDGTANVAFTGPEVGSVPSGGIIMWSGSIASVPAGWFLCDGANGTPDLRDRFVVGAGSSYAVAATGGADFVTLVTANLPAHAHTFSGTTGGQSNDHSHFLNLNTNGSGEHTHNFFHGARNVGGSTPGGFGLSFFGSPITAPDAAGVTETRTRGDMVQAGGNHAHNVQGNTAGTSSNHTHTVSGTTGSTGSGQAHENRPPYLALAYIMKA